MSNYSVQQLAKLGGVSVRTLHYYDQIGLLKPSHLQGNGYRSYGSQEVMRLQQILFFRELEFPLDDIKRMLDAPTYNHLAALKDQKELMLLKRDRLNRLLTTINSTITHMEEDTTFEDAHKLAGLDNETIAEYKKEVYQKYDPKLVQQSNQRVKQLGKEGMKRVMAESEAINVELASHIGEDPGSDEVQALVAKHHQWMNNFYDCSIEIYRGLSDLYTQDPRFKANIDKVAEGYTEFLQSAMRIYCDRAERKD